MYLWAHGVLKKKRVNENIVTCYLFILEALFYEVESRHVWMYLKFFDLLPSFTTRNLYMGWETCSYGGVHLMYCENVHITVSDETERM